MILKEISSLGSTRKKFFINSTYIMSKSVRIKRFFAQEAKMCQTANSSLESTRRKFFMNSTYIMSRKQESNVLGSGSRNDSKRNQLARIGEKKIFHELDVHHVYKEGMKRFWAQEAEMSLTAISLFESARGKFFMNSTYIMSRMKESNVFGLRRPKWVYKPLACSNRREEKFSWTRRTSCLESRNQTFLGSGGRNESNSHQLARIGERKIFHELDVHHV